MNMPRIINPQDIWTINFSEKDTTEIQQTIYQCEQCEDKGWYFDYDVDDYQDYELLCPFCEKGRTKEINKTIEAIERFTRKLKYLLNVAGEKREIKND